MPNGHHSICHSLVAGVHKFLDPFYLHTELSACMSAHALKPMFSIACVCVCLSELHTIQMKIKFENLFQRIKLCKSSQKLMNEHWTWFGSCRRLEIEEKKKRWIFSSNFGYNGIQMMLQPFIAVPQMLQNHSIGIKLGQMLAKLRQLTEVSTAHQNCDQTKKQKCASLH